MKKQNTDHYEEKIKRDSQQNNINDEGNNELNQITDKLNEDA